MLLKGKKIEGPNVEIVVLPRGSDSEIVFHCAAVLNMAVFEQLCPIPKAPTIVKRGGIQISNPEDRGYRGEVQQHGKLRTAWMIIESLKATEGLVWETVDAENPQTWLHYETELRDSGFSEMEIVRIVNAVMTANCLNEDRINEARERFLAGQQAQSVSQNSPVGEQSNTRSGEPANV